MDSLGAETELVTRLEVPGRRNVYDISQGQGRGWSDL